MQEFQDFENILLTYTVIESKIKTYVRLENFATYLDSVRKGNRGMKFNYQENMCVNVKEAIEKSTKNDYVDFGDALGVIVHKSFYFEVIIVYDEIHDIVSVEIVKNDTDCLKIREKDLEMTDEERDLIVKELSTHIS